MIPIKYYKMLILFFLFNQNCSSRTSKVSTYTL